MTELPKLGAPARRALSELGITCLEDLTRFSRAQIGNLHGVGPRTMSLLQAALSARGLSFQTAEAQVNAAKAKKAERNKP